ncbi:MAG: tetratricopeptide repeat protein [Terriglobales bacterium]
MAFGFGFNKAKVLASAEKNVKQGRLQNAIADYEKIAKEDPKDLTVLNTIGDLYARVGDTEQATAYFKRVGDAYASDGFTVKAIAMYKKLTKQNPNATDAILKLAELYTQQGLYNDARAQYMVVADAFLRKNDLDQAVIVFQRVLELDPDNMSMQNRVAELYVRVNKKAEARDLYFRSAQALHAKGALDACDDALEHVIGLDPGFMQAVLLRGQVRLQAEDADGAIRYLEMLPDIDSRQDALRLLLQAYLQLGKIEEAEPIARKILNVFNDPSGITALADAMMASGAHENALRLYREHSDRLLSADSTAVVEAMHGCISAVKENSRALEILRELFSKADNTTHLAEVTELLAHAYVQEGALTSARDLYQKLAELEPQNPLHAQNYKQIMAKLGQDAVGRPLTAEQGAQAFMVEELEATAPALEQVYPAEVSEAIKAALTDAELFDSYNLPARAIGPLEAVLPRAPQDVQLNQRLASLYARAGRFADAAERCTALQAAYAEAGHSEQAREYADLAARYRERSGLSSEQAQLEPVPAPKPERGLVLDLPGLDSSAISPPRDVTVGEQPSTVSAHGGFRYAPPSSSTTPPAAVGSSAPQAAVTEFDFGAQAGSTFPDFDVESPPTTAPPAPPEPHAVVVPEPVISAPEEAIGAHEIDLSEEWDRIQTEETAGAAPGPAQVPLPALSGGESAEQSAAGPNVISDLLEEIRFYLSQSMWEEARVALARADSVAPGLSVLGELRAQLAAGQKPSAASALAEEVPEIAIIEPSLETVEAPEHPTAAEHVFDDSALGETRAVRIEPPLQVPLVPAPVTQAPAPVAPAAQATIPSDPQPGSQTAPAGVEDIAALVDIAAAADAAAGPEAITAAAELTQLPPVASREDMLGGFVLDLEESLGDDFLVEAPADRAAAATLSSSAPQPPDSQVSLEVVTPVTPAPPLTPSAPALVTAPSLDEGRMTVAAELEEIAATGLSDLFAEFKEDMEAGTETAEDPETHYNLGVAFKEMGLLDEAIGELQKVCQGIEHGQPFSQVIEAYTWLADCFVQKGVPEAGIRWYEKSLKVAGIDDVRATAIHYELACAHQAAGDRAAALRHFMEVYGTNIDYRDVAERIKSLKS